MQGMPSTQSPPPRAAKQRRKGDRLVIACQEQTYWLVNRPPVSPPAVRVWGHWPAQGSVCFPDRCSQDHRFEPVEGPALEILVGAGRSCFVT